VASVDVSSVDVSPSDGSSLASSVTTMTVALADTIGQIRIHPNYLPGVFRIRRLVLLVPAE